MYIKCQERFKKICSAVVLKKRKKFVHHAVRETTQERKKNCVGAGGLMLAVTVGR